MVINLSIIFYVDNFKYKTGWTDLVSKKSNDDNWIYRIRVNGEKSCIQFYYSDLLGNPVVLEVPIDLPISKLAVCMQRTFYEMVVYLNGMRMASRPISQEEIGNNWTYSESFIHDTVSSLVISDTILSENFLVMHAAKIFKSSFRFDCIEYTVNVGGYDKFRADLLNIKPELPGSVFKSSWRESRLPKILAHHFFDAEFSMYWDSNIFKREGITVDYIIDKILGDCDIIVAKHPHRDCVYDEIVAALKRVQDPLEKKILRQQFIHYEQSSIGRGIQVYSYQPLVRRHSKLMESFNEAWWSEMSRWSYRDQVSFPIVLKKFPSLRVKVISAFPVEKISHEETHIYVKDEY